MKGRRRPIVVKKKKYQEIMSSEVKQSRLAMSELMVQVSKANELCKISTDMFKSVSNRLEYIKFMRTLPRGSAEYNAAQSEYMKDREE